MKARADLGLKPEEPGPLKDKKVKADLQAQYSAVIDDGMKNLQKALDIDPNYDDAMAYMNLLIREKADLDDTPEQYKTDTDTADKWVQKGAGHQEDESGQSGGRRCAGRYHPPPKRRKKLSKVRASDRFALRSVTCPMR
jgi:hypothetical protein